MNVEVIRMTAELLLRRRKHDLKRKGLIHMHTLTSSVEVKKLDPVDVDGIEM